MTDLAEMKDQLMESLETREEYEAQAPEFTIAQELITARVRAGLSQAGIAERMGTSQSTIARIESGRTLPSLRTLDRYAKATGSRAVVKLEAQT